MPWLNPHGLAVFSSKVRVSSIYIIESSKCFYSKNRVLGLREFNISFYLASVGSPLFMGQYRKRVSKKAKIRNQYDQVPHLTQDTTWKSDKNTIELHMQASQEVSPFQAGDHKAAMKRQKSMTNTKHK